MGLYLMYAGNGSTRRKHGILPPDLPQKITPFTRIANNLM